ncbi:MAG: T9SS type A sorting domain-containing protein [Bacteroidota bacterium]|nr:T9SS type A sorting domain-containing protein [Bacteroidota bacterium]
MRRILSYLFIPSLLCLIPFSAKSQSTIEFQSGTQIEVTTGADICADNVIINGSYSGSGTKCGGALPVELVSFTVSSHWSNAELYWTTATEMNNYGFEIEKSRIQNTEVSSKNKIEAWGKIAFVEGNGTTNVPKEYSFTDKNISIGKYSYRLKQIDRDGKFEYSHEVEVVISPIPQMFALMQNYPNPFNPTTVISYQLPVNSHVSLKVYDAIGREVATLVNDVKEAGYYSVTFDASRLSTGMYIYILRAENFVVSKKLLLLK